MTAPEAYTLLVNTESGAFRTMGKEAFAARVEKSGLKVDKFGYFSPAEMKDAIGKYKEADMPLMVAGGDGTICALAGAMMGGARPFAILPMGTMNLLAHDLGIGGNMDTALARYARGARRVDIDVGMVNDHIFMCCAGLMVLPAASSYREQHRSDSASLLLPRMTLFVLEQMDRSHSRPFTLQIEGRAYKIRSAALVVSNNQYEPEERLGENNFHRISLTDGKLGVYTAAPTGIWRKIGLILRLRFGDWRRDPGMRSWVASQLTIESGQTTEDVSLDGETVQLATPLRFSIRKRALPLLIPEAA